MEYVLIIGLGAFILLAAFTLLKVPGSDMVFTSPDSAAVQDMKRYLEDNGIEVYIKGMDMQRLHETAYDLVNPTLHVVRLEDRPRAVRLVEEVKRGSKPADTDAY